MRSKFFYKILIFTYLTICSKSTIHKNSTKIFFFAFYFLYILYIKISYSH